MSQADLQGCPVAILGWAGSTPRQLRSLVGHYRSKGAVPFTHHARVFRAMARPDGWEREGEELAARVRAHLRRAEGPMLVHLFSNAGFWSFAALLRALPTGLHARIAGVVLDSAPGYPDVVGPRFYAKHATMAMMPMLLRALGRPPALDHPWLRPPLWAFFRGWYHLSHAQHRNAAESLRTIRELERPMLFLYSEADRLVPASMVEAFVDSVGRPVQRERFVDSSHVVHMVRHRKRYLGAVHTFLAGVLAPTEG